MAKAKKPGRPKGDPRDVVILRMPPELRKRVGEVAEETRRSMNATILECIVAQLDHVEEAMTLDQVWLKVEALEEKVKSLSEDVQYLQGRGDY